MSNGSKRGSVWVAIAAIGTLLGGLAAIATVWPLATTLIADGGSSASELERMAASYCLEMQGAGFDASLAEDDLSAAIGLPRKVIVHRATFMVVASDGCNCTASEASLRFGRNGLKLYADSAKSSVTASRDRAEFYRSGIASISNAKSNPSQESYDALKTFMGRINQDYTPSAHAAYLQGLPAKSREILSQIDSLGRDCQTRSAGTHIN